MKFIISTGHITFPCYAIIFYTQKLGTTTYLAEQLTEWVVSAHYYMLWRVFLDIVTYCPITIVFWSINAKSEEKKKGFWKLKNIQWGIVLEEILLQQNSLYSSSTYNNKRCTFFYPENFKVLSRDSKLSTIITAPFPSFAPTTDHWCTWAWHSKQQHLQIAGKILMITYTSGSG